MFLSPPSPLLHCLSLSPVSPFSLFLRPLIHSPSSYAFSPSPFQFPSFLGEHSLAWSLEWRETFGFFSSAPMSVRKHGGHTLKSSIKVGHRRIMHVIW